MDGLDIWYKLYSKKMCLESQFFKVWFCVNSWAICTVLFGIYLNSVCKTPLNIMLLFCIKKAPAHHAWCLLKALFVIYIIVTSIYKYQRWIEIWSYIYNFLYFCIWSRPSHYHQTSYLQTPHYPVIPFPLLPQSPHMLRQWLVMGGSMFDRRERKKSFLGLALGVHRCDTWPHRTDIIYCDNPAGTLVRIV